MKEFIYPQEIILEVTNHCNLRCRYCHFHGEQAVKKRSEGHMETGLWREILTELQNWPQEIHLLTHGAGEPLLYPHLAELLQAAKTLDNIKVGFMTNGMLLSPEWAHWLVSHQIDFLAFSIDGTKPETHDFFRRKAKLERIEQNVFSLIQEKENQGSQLPVLNFNMVGYPEVLSQTEDFVHKWLPYADMVTVAKFRPIGSRFLWQYCDEQPAFRPCPLLYNQCVIGFDGRIGLCCEDIQLEVEIGSCYRQDIATLFNNSPTLLEYRKRHELGDLSGLQLCQDCHVWAGDIVQNKHWQTIGDMQVLCKTTPAFWSYTQD